MDFTLPEAFHDLSTLTRGILADRVTPDRLRELEAKDEPFDRPLWTDLAGAGVLAAAADVALSRSSERPCAIEQAA